LEIKVLDIVDARCNRDIVDARCSRIEIEFFYKLCSNFTS